MVSFQETAVIDVEMVRRPSPGRRRLRFSFPINDVKDPTGEPAPPFSARRRRGAAYLVAPLFRVNRNLRRSFRSSSPPPEGCGRQSEVNRPAFSCHRALPRRPRRHEYRPEGRRSGVSIDPPLRCQSAFSRLFFPPPPRSAARTQRSPEGRRGASLKVPAIRLRVGNLVADRSKIKSFLNRPLGRGRSRRSGQAVRARPPRAAAARGSPHRTGDAEPPRAGEANPQIGSGAIARRTTTA